MAIIRIYTGTDGKSHFQEIEPDFQEDTQGVGDRLGPWTQERSYTKKAA